MIINHELACQLCQIGWDVPPRFSTSVSHEVWNSAYCETTSLFISFASHSDIAIPDFSSIGDISVMLNTKH